MAMPRVATDLGACLTGGPSVRQAQAVCAPTSGGAS